MIKTFNKGDKVIRFNNHYNDMAIGDTDIILDELSSGIVLQNYGNGHSPNNLKLVKATKTNWRKRLEKNE